MLGRIALVDRDEVARLLSPQRAAVGRAFHRQRSPETVQWQAARPQFGTADGKSCAPTLIEHVRVCTERYAFSHVLNGRFKGGYITRQYGEPARGIHAIQLEMSQCLYMNEDAPFSYRPALAARVQPLLREMLEIALNALPKLPPASI